jgi:hypothetical protein
MINPSVIKQRDFSFLAGYLFITSQKQKKAAGIGCF